MIRDAQVLAAAVVVGIAAVAVSSGTAQVGPAAPITEANLENPNSAD